MLKFDGLIFFSDLAAYWVDQLQILVDVLNTPFYSVVSTFISSYSGAFSPIVKRLFDWFFPTFGLFDVTILEFVLSSMGAFFGIYFAIVIISWVLNIIT